MGFLNKIDNKVKHLGSKQSESSEINALRKKIKDEESSIDARNAQIGQFYWNLYADGKITPEGESIEYFKSIVASLELIKKYNEEIDARKAAGEEERKRIDEETRLKEEQRLAEVEERKRKLEEERKKQEEEAEARRREEAGNS